MFNVLNGLEHNNLGIYDTFIIYYKIKAYFNHLKLCHNFFFNFFSIKNLLITIIELSPLSNTITRLTIKSSIIIIIIIRIFLKLWVYIIYMIESRVQSNRSSYLKY